MPAAEKFAYFGAYVRKLRSEAGLSLRDVQKLSDEFPAPVAFDYLSRIEQGRAVPSARKLLTLSQIYDIPAHHFLDVLELEGFSRYSPRTNDPERCRQSGVEALEKGDFQKAFACLQKGVVLLETGAASLPPESLDLLTRLHNNLAVCLGNIGKHRLAQFHLERALENQSLDDDMISGMLANLANIAYQIDRLPIAEALASASARRAEQANNTDQLGRSWITLANITFDQARVGVGETDLTMIEKAAKLYRSALSLHADKPASRETIITTFNLANCLSKQSLFDEADSLYRKGFEQAAINGSPYLRTIGLLDRGRSLFMRRDMETARSVLIEARALSKEHGYVIEEFHSIYYVWRIALDQKVGSEALELFRELKKLRLKLDQRSEEVQAFDTYLQGIRSRRRRRKGGSR